MTQHPEAMEPSGTARIEPSVGILAAFREYGKLARVEGGGYAVVAIFGALAAGSGTVGGWLVAGLFLVNLLFLLGGCIHNDLMDIEVDRQVAKLSDQPLVQGTVSRAQARWASTACFLGSLLLAWCLTSSIAVVSALAASIMFALLYNAFSKRVFGADLLFAISASLLCLCGGLAAASGRETPYALGGTLWVVVGIVLIDHFFFNSVEGGLKDIGSDERAGASTIARRVFRNSDGLLRPTSGVKAFFLALKAVSVALVFLPFLAFEFPFWAWQLAALSVASAFTLVFTWELVGDAEFDQKRITRLTMFQEMACRSLVPLLLGRAIGVEWMLALIMAPVAWFFTFNYLLYGRLFTNPKTV